MIRLVLAVSLAIAAASAHCADARSKYSVRGSGLLTCAHFVQARKTRSNAYYAFAGWIDGFVTARNQQQENTYDVLSFESLELLMLLINQHCEKHPNDHFFSVVNSLLERRQGDRLVEESPILKVQVGKRTALHYVETIIRLQKKLGALGYFHGTVTGGYGDDVKRAVAAYQKDHGMKPTGFPDQTTLWRIFVLE